MLGCRTFSQYESFTNNYQDATILYQNNGRGEKVLTMLIYYWLIAMLLWKKEKLLEYILTILVFLHVKNADLLLIIYRKRLCQKKLTDRHINHMSSFEILRNDGTLYRI
jgi:hypothetical protein